LAAPVGGVIGCAVGIATVFALAGMVGYMDYEYSGLCAVFFGTVGAVPAAMIGVVLGMAEGPDAKTVRMLVATVFGGLCSGVVYSFIVVPLATVPAVVVFWTGGGAVCLGMCCRCRGWADGAAGSAGEWIEFGVDIRQGGGVAMRLLDAMLPLPRGTVEGAGAFIRQSGVRRRGGSGRLAPPLRTRRRALGSAELPCGESADPPANRLEPRWSSRTVDRGR